MSATTRLTTESESLSWNEGLAVVSPAGPSGTAAPMSNMPARQTTTTTAATTTASARAKVVRTLRRSPIAEITARRMLTAVRTTNSQQKTSDEIVPGLGARRAQIGRAHV